jgi:hypothetical protein
MSDSTSPVDTPKHEAPSTGLLSNKLYDSLKEVAQVWLPAAGALYFALSGIWGFPFGEEVVGTITAVDLFLGAGLKLSTNSYNKSVA